MLTIEQVVYLMTKNAVTGSFLPVLLKVLSALLTTSKKDPPWDILTGEPDWEQSSPVGFEAAHQAAWGSGSPDGPALE